MRECVRPLWTTAVALLSLGVLAGWAPSGHAQDAAEGKLSLSLASQPPTPETGLQLRVHVSRNEPFSEVAVELELPEGLGGPDDAGRKRALVASGDGLKDAAFTMHVPVVEPGHYALAAVASWGEGEVRTEMEVLIPEDREGPHYMMTTSGTSSSISCRNVRLRDFAYLIGRILDRKVEADPQYASARMDNYSGSRSSLSSMVSRAGLTYARKPDGALVLRPSLSRNMQAVNEHSVRKQDDGQIHISVHDTDCVGLLERLFEVAGIGWVTPDTLTATPVRVSTDGAKPFEQALTMLCRSAGWKWSTDEEGKYVIRVAEE